jgi:hypothetical protein
MSIHRSASGVPLHAHRPPPLLPLQYEKRGSHEFLYRSHALKHVGWEPPPTPGLFSTKVAVFTLIYTKYSINNT